MSDVKKDKVQIITREEINEIIERITKDQNINLDLFFKDNNSDWFDMALIKFLKGSNSASKGNVNSNQSSILLTGDRVNIFPCIKRFEFANENVGKNIVLKSNIKLMSNNILYLKGIENFQNENTIINSFVTTNETTSGRVELGCKTIDGEDYVLFYENLSAGDVIIILKLTSRFEYIAIGVKHEDLEKYFKNIKIEEIKVINYFDKTRKVSKNSKDNLTYIDSDCLEINNDSTKDSDIKNNKFSVKFKNKIIFYGLSMAEAAYRIVEHYTMNNKKSFDSLKKDFKGISELISKKQPIEFLLEEEEIGGSSYKREKNYSTKNRPLIECNFNGEIYKFGVYTQWYNTGKRKNFDKFINEIKKLGYVVEKENKMEIAKNAINKIYFGAPGTGKSRYVEDLYYNDFAKRVTFHPDYTYNDFVGYIRPVMEENNLIYKFVPGIFTEILLEALKDPFNMYTLIIEEMNRANTSSVFGDLFQLLDRNEEGDSEYRINNIDIYKYIKDEMKSDYEYEDGSIGIPSNLNIIATMNTADQNVFVMDTAFKRRWEFEYISVEFDETHEFKDKVISGLEVSWEKFVKEINSFMMAEENDDLFITEDKQIGQYFVKENELNDCKRFAYKVLMYLWEDVFKMDRYRLFNEEIRTFSELISKFSTDDAIDIFNLEFIDKLQK